MMIDKVKMKDLDDLASEIMDILKDDFYCDECLEFLEEKQLELNVKSLIKIDELTRKAIDNMLKGKASKMSKNIHKRFEIEKVVCFVNMKIDEFLK